MYLPWVVLKRLELSSRKDWPLILITTWLSVLGRLRLKSLCWFAYISVQYARLQGAYLVAQLILVIVERKLLVRIQAGLDVQKSRLFEQLWVIGGQRYLLGSISVHLSDIFLSLFASVSLLLSLYIHIFFRQCVRKSVDLLPGLVSTMTAWCLALMTSVPA